MEISHIHHWPTVIIKKKKTTTTISPDIETAYTVH